MNSAVAAEFKNGVIVLSFHVKKKFTTGETNDELAGFDTSTEC